MHGVIHTSIVCVYEFRRGFCTSVLSLLCLRFNACSGVSEALMLPMCCWCCACCFVVCSRVSHCLMLAMRSLLCVCRFLVSSSVSHALLAALRTLSLCLLSVGLLRFVCCAFAGNTCPHGQANLRTCSVASHCGHAFLRRIYRHT